MGKYSMSLDARQRKTLEWIRRARSDIKAAEKMLAVGDDFEPYLICFCAQQSAEKSLKAGLIYAQVAFDLTHDLNDLAYLLPDGWQARRVVGLLGGLSSYGVETRYPDARKVPTIDDAKQAVKQGRAIFNSICKDLEA